MVLQDLKTTLSDFVQYCNNNNLDQTAKELEAAISFYHVIRHEKTTLKRFGQQLSDAIENYRSHLQAALLSLEGATTDQEKEMAEYISVFLRQI